MKKKETDFRGVSSDKLQLLEKYTPAGIKDNGDSLKNSAERQELRDKAYRKKIMGMRHISEEDADLLEEFKKDMFHLCRVRPFRGDGWVNGYIAGVYQDGRFKRFMYAVVTEDNKRISKSCVSNGIVVLPDLVDPGKYKKTSKNRVDRFGRKITSRIPFEFEQANVYLRKHNIAMHNVGHCVRVITTDEAGYVKKIDGRIIGLIAPITDDTALYYKIKVWLENDKSLILLREIKEGGVEISPEIDGFGEELNIRYLDTHIDKVRVKMNQYCYTVYCEKEMRRAERILEKAREDYEKARGKYLDARAELGSYIESGINPFEWAADPTVEM